MSNKELPATLIEAIRYFSDFDNCIATRWPHGVTCPTCGSKDVRFIAPRRVWECKNKHARKQFSAKIGTIFEDSPINLDKWFAAVWLIANCKNGVSSYEIARDLGVMQKTAWFMLQRIRMAMHEQEEGMLSGTVEADETFIGGLARNMHKHKKEKVIKGRGGSGKAIVMGLLERGEKSEKSKQKIIDSLDHDPKKDKKPSRVRTTVIANTDRKTLHREIRDKVEKGTTLYTDALASYQGLEPDYVHQFVDHAETYVNGTVHTNGMENFWSLLKRSIKGTYVSVEPFHLFRYLDEQAFRFNNHKELNDDDRFNIVVSQISGKRLTYSQLTGKAKDETPGDIK